MFVEQSVNSPGDKSGWDVEVLIVRGESACQHLIASSVGRRGDSVFPNLGVSGMHLSTLGKNRG